MSTLTIRLPDTKHERLKAFARARGVSVNKLVFVHRLRAGDYRVLSAGCAAHDAQLTLALCGA